jgi:hypothetical protein
MLIGFCLRHIVELLQGMRTCSPRDESEWIRTLLIKPIHSLTGGIRLFILIGLGRRLSRGQRPEGKC